MCKSESRASFFPERCLHIVVCEASQLQTLGRLSVSVRVTAVQIWKCTSLSGDCDAHSFSDCRLLHAVKSRFADGKRKGSAELAIYTFAVLEAEIEP